ncbi:WD40 repeat domain-containing protein [Pedobacter sp. L105]|uniref:WD40 repeat domain-containing protein n=1 Tax=Pedobacter sp. L105 TaxID=1641871 RepID=UPI00131EA6EB|nr:WD40 repeat domain-containing protein [Pedobacter sp. L105]
MLEHVKSLSGHQNPVYALTNSGKPGIFFTAGNDKGVVEWSLDKMNYVKVLMPVKTSVYSLEHYNNQLFVGLRSGEISIFDLDKQLVTANFQAHEKPVFDVVAVPGKQEFLTASEDGTVGVWSLVDHSLLYRIPVSADTVRSIAISPDGQQVAFACKDTTVKIYNLKDYGLLHTLQKHTLPVTSVQYEPSGKYLVTGGRDAQLNFWSMPDYQLKHTIPAHMFSIYGIAFNPVRPYFATASQDKSIKIWGTEDLKLHKIVSIEKGTQGHTHSINKIIWTRDGEYLISTGDDKLVIVWDWEI